MLRRAWRSPIVHFVALGAALFAIARMWPARDAAPSALSLRQPIAIDAARIRALTDAYRRDVGAPPTPAQLEGLVRDAVDDELLYREARLLGLDVGDRRIALRLAQKMRALSDDPQLDDAALERAARALGLDDDVVVRRLLQDKLRRRLAVDGSAPPPSDDELQAYLERHRAQYLAPATLSFTHVFLS
ncbi:MAG: parvulin-like peptidyl-prolyl isomerase, partial [bacterium]|nr:parvulin-like peptidyl-prolyl isomerase [bacterium]